MPFIRKMFIFNIYFNFICDKYYWAKAKIRIKRVDLQLGVNVAFNSKAFEDIFKRNVLFTAMIINYDFKYFTKRYFWLEVNFDNI